MNSALPYQDLDIYVREQIADAIDALQSVRNCAAILTTLRAAAETTAASLRKGGTVMIAGNGGSAADAQHLAAEFVSRLVSDRPALRAIALSTDTSCLTAIGNDYGYERVFERQIEALGDPGDVFVAISTSGNSPNIVRALQRSHEMGITTIGLGGRGPATMDPLCDFLMAVPARMTQHIQEAHLVLEHIFCDLVERSYFQNRV